MNELNCKAIMVSDDSGDIVAIIVNTLGEFSVILDPVFENDEFTSKRKALEYVEANQP